MTLFCFISRGSARVGRDCQDDIDNATPPTPFLCLIKLSGPFFNSSVDHGLWNALGPPLLEMRLAVGNEEVKLFAQET